MPIFIPSIDPVSIAINVASAVLATKLSGDSGTDASSGVSSKHRR
jgi:hypothetical protein